MLDAFPFLFVRFGDNAPVEAGVYLKASEVAAWLDLNGCPALAAELRAVEHRDGQRRAGIRVTTPTPDHEQEVYLV